MRLLSSIEENCWVLVLKHKAVSNYRIVFTLRQPEQMMFGATEKLMYSRHFDNVIDALGHKLLLENISDESIKRLIR